MAAIDKYRADIEEVEIEVHQVKKGIRYLVYYLLKTNTALIK